jgi:hypothetical protein
VRVTLTGYTLAQLPNGHPRSAVQFPVPAGLVSPTTGMVSWVTPWASVVRADTGIAGDCAATAPRLRPLRVSTNLERLVSGLYTVTLSVRS